VIPRLLLLLLGVAALTMVLPLILALIFREEEMIRPFGISAVLVLVPALPVVPGLRKKQIRFSVSDGFLLVFLTWLLVCLLGAAPYYFSGRIPRLADAVFESVSGFTTTGATVVADVEAMPRSLLFWRAMTHWLGGMGIVVLSVALLPLLGIGGLRLLQAESPGPETDRITPRITATAKILWLLYIALTALQTVLLLLGGMNWFDALVHAFATTATGGFSSRNSSIAAYHSPWIEWVCIVFMLIAGFNFNLTWRLLRMQFREVADNSEAKAYWGIVLLSGTLVTLAVYNPASPEGASLGSALRQGFFHTASIITSTGFTAADHTLWPAAAQGVLFILLFIGGCSGSTSGGIKVIRHVVLFKQMGNEMKRLLYPRGVFSIRLNRKVGRKDVVYGVAGFVFVYILLVLAEALLLCSSGTDPFSSLNLALFTVGNVGIGFGTLGLGLIPPDMPDYVKWGLSFGMIAGRLELWTALVIFSPDYWRR
jgi:trk system potassium uptake protein TrkH